MKNFITATIVTACIVVVIGLFSLALVNSFEQALTERCEFKDPQDILPGWSDNRLEFGQSYSLLILVDTDGSNHYFINTIPGWYAIDVPIDYVVMCK